MIFLTRRATFSASHYYWNEAWPAEKNEQVFGRCANRNGHGHNYTLEVTVAGEPDPVTGFVVDLKWLKDVMEREVLAAYDHRHLNLECRSFEGKADSDHGEHCDCGVEAAGAGGDGGGRRAVEPGSRV
jgi:6-pyruvoyltetrahydropterin/6-carboxytetrahydropterin synthase